MAAAVDCVVAGAGVVGLAVARSLAKAGKQVVVLEKQPRAGQGISSRSSSVIHAGIYYAQGSLKAKMCVRGRELLYEYAAANSIKHLRRGKLIVATSPEQLGKLAAVRDSAVRNGVTDVKLLSRGEALAMEPALECHGALHSPSTGVVDSDGLVQALEKDIVAFGGLVAFGHAVSKVQRRAGDRICVTAAVTEGENVQVECSHFVNSLGLDAVSLANKCDTGVASHDGRVPGTAHLCKGSYFRLRNSKSPFESLVYPLPEAHGLGIHLTVDVNGVARFGPDVEWIDVGPSPTMYDVDESKAPAFARAVRRYYPALNDDDLVPDYSGIRPKLGPASEPARDFCVWGPKQHAVSGLVHLLGIESPGLTSSLALGEYVLGQEVFGESLFVNI